jgi:dolichol-phosphate mannosyltransferase
MRLTLLIPALDERENLEILLPELLTAIPDLLELIVVDDGSRDGTQEAVRALSARDARLRLLERAPPPSLTASLREGFQAAAGDAIGWMDADRVIAVSDFVRLLDEVRSGADFAVASRFAPGGGIKSQTGDGWRERLQALPRLRSTRDSPLEAVLSWSLNALVLPLMLGAGVHDYTSGIVVARRSALERLVFRGQHGEYMIGLWLQARDAGLRIVELGYHARPRLSGESKTAVSPARLIAHGARYLHSAVVAAAERRRIRLD